MSGYLSDSQVRGNKKSKHELLCCLYQLFVHVCITLSYSPSWHGPSEVVLLAVGACPLMNSVIVPIKLVLQCSGATIVSVLLHTDQAHFVCMDRFPLSCFMPTPDNHCSTTLSSTQCTCREYSINHSKNGTGKLFLESILWYTQTHMYTKCPITC